MDGNSYIGKSVPLNLTYESLLFWFAMIIINYLLILLD